MSPLSHRILHLVLYLGCIHSFAPEHPNMLSYLQSQNMTLDYALLGVKDAREGSTPTYSSFDINWELLEVNIFTRTPQ